jgi:hypothetical protein
VTNGWNWAKGVLDNAGRFILLAAVVGVPTVIFVVRGNPVGIGIGVGLAVVVCLSEGAYQTFHDVQLKLEEHESATAAQPVLHFGTEGESGWTKTYDAATAAGQKSKAPHGAFNTTHEYVIRVNNDSLVVADRVRVRLMSVEPSSAGTDLPCDLPALNPLGTSTMRDILADDHDYAVLSTFHVYATGATELEGHIRTIHEPVRVNLELWRDSNVHDRQTLWVRLPGQPT